MKDDNILFSNKIRVFSLIFAIGMVGYHANATVIWKSISVTNSVQDTIFYILDKVLTSMGGLGLTFFFANSAFLLYHNLNRDNMKGKVFRRFKTLGVPFLIWNAFGGVCYNLFVLNPKDSALEVVCKVLLSNYCGVMWFVEALLLYLLLMPLINIFSHKVLSFALIVFLWGWMKYKGLDINVVQIGQAEWNIGRIIYYIPTYLLGAWFGTNYSDVIMSEKYRNKCISILSGCVFVIGYMLQLFCGIDCNIVLIMAIWMFVPKTIFQKCNNWKWYISFYIYAMHEFVLGMAIIVFRKLGFDTYAINITQAVIYRGIMIIGTFIIAVSSARVMIDFLPKLYSVLTGGRSPHLERLKGRV